MNLDDFEQRLQRQPLRRVPDEWRAEILGATARQTSGRPDQAIHWLSTLNSRLSTLLWPHPQAWAGLAAVWVVIFALKLSTGNETRVAGKNSSVSPEVLAELRQQKQLFVELVGGEAVGEAKRPKSFLPRPRSERRDEVRAV